MQTWLWSAQLHWPSACYHTPVNPRKFSHDCHLDIYNVQKLNIKQKLPVHTRSIHVSHPYFSTFVKRLFKIILWIVQHAQFLLSVDVFAVVYWGFWSAWTWHFVAGWVVPSILKEHFAIIFKSKGYTFLWYTGNHISNDAISHLGRQDTCTMRCFVWTVPCDVSCTLSQSNIISTSTNKCT